MGTNCLKLKLYILIKRIYTQTNILTMSFPVEKFYVSHFTDIKRIRNIITSRALQPAGMQKNYVGRYRENAEEHGDLEKYDNSVFYSIIFPDDDGVPIFKESRITGYGFFVFSPKIIEDNAKMVGRRGVSELPIFCKAWNYGKIHEHCYTYETDKSLEENLNSWRQIMSENIKQYMIDPETERLTSAEGRTLNTELLLEGEMPIDMDLIAIYIPKVKHIVVKHSEAFLAKYPFMRGSEERMKKKYEDEEAEVENLIKEHPDLPWTRENPFK
jgi:hypothetical protein